MKSDLEMYLGDFLAVPARDVRYRENKRVPTLLGFSSSGPTLRKCIPFHQLTFAHLTVTLSISFNCTESSLRRLLRYGKLEGSKSAVPTRS